MPQNMQKWTKFEKLRERKNLKANRIIGLGSTCEWLLVVFAQVELVPMAIAAGRFANARPIHRTGWWIHRTARNESKVSGKALTAGQTDLVPCAAPHDSERGKIYWDSLSTIFATDKVCLMEHAVSMQLTEIKTGCPSIVITTWVFGTLTPQKHSNCGSSSQMDKLGRISG